MSDKLKQIEATLTFEDGETCKILIASDDDSAWGNTPKVLWRSVPVRQAISEALHQEELLAEGGE